MSKRKRHGKLAAGYRAAAGGVATAAKAGSAKADVAVVGALDVAGGGDYDADEAASSAVYEFLSDLVANAGNDVSSAAYDYAESAVQYDRASLVDAEHVYDSAFSAAAEPTSSAVESHIESMVSAAHDAASRGEYDIDDSDIQTMLDSASDSIQSFANAIYHGSAVASHLGEAYSKAESEARRNESQLRRDATASFVSALVGDAAGDASSVESDIRDSYSASAVDAESVSTASHSASDASHWDSYASHWDSDVSHQDSDASNAASNAKEMPRRR